MLVFNVALNENQHHSFEGATIEICDAIKDSNGVELKTSTRMSSNDYISTPDPWESIPALKSLWVYRPPSLQSHQSNEQSQQVVLKPPHLVTRLAKPLTFGFDPFFNKGYFEPFERRQKPVTLVTFRKHGIQPRKMADPNSEPDEVAELQSAFNDISNFWHEVPEVINI
ncbi:unnamed protein product [Euphydryas editha]|uniref:Uncharacterized protein n=1 Tax=Euphydryas editha TaxID=104508 RepID=A0AAU9UZG3_EUPED|nr:unnamed protein product [Euphydryas editha]